MKALVTGASGFVGSAVARKLIEQGHEVRVTLRPSSDRRNIQDLPVEQVNADLTDAESLKKAIEGCDSLFHVAADYRLWSLNPDELYQTNVEGTRKLMQAALDSGVERIVYTSSVAVLGLHPDGKPSTEDTPSSLETMIGHYKRSKFLAEEVVKSLIREKDLPAVIVNPSTPVGPRDRRPTPTGRMVADATLGKMPAYVNTGLNIVHVDDVAEGHLLAYQHGKIGERYILGGTDMSLKDILTTIAELTDQKAPKICIPHNLILPIAYLSEAFARLTRGKEPQVTVDGIRMAKKWMYFSCEKANRELGYRPRPPEEALRDAVEWVLREQARG